MAKKVQLMTNTKQWQTINGVEVLIDIPQEDIDPITDSSCVEIEGQRTLEETINQDNMFTPEIVETKVHSKVGGVYHDNVVDSAYEEAILYGNTQVNLVESVTTGSKYIPHSFTSFQGNESKIGNYHSGRTNQVAPLVKGVTMVNLAQETSASINSNGSTKIYNIKPNTKYTLSLVFTVQNTEKGFVVQSYSDDTYLESSMTKTKMDTNVKFTFITHENANQIRIRNASAYGGETIQLDNIMVIEGDVTDLNLPFFKGMRSVELSRPLTNLFTDDLVHYNQNTSSTNTNGNITVTSTSVSSWNDTDYYLKNLKPHTKYIAMWDSLTTTQTATTQQEILICAVCVVGNIKLGGINENEKCPTLRSIIFDTGDKDLNEIIIRVHASMSNSEATSTTVKGLRVFEWDDSLRTLDLQAIGYFSGTKYVSVRALETEGKNLYPYGDVNFTSTFENGWHDAKGNAYMTGDIASKSQTRFLLRKGTYYLSNGSNSNVVAIQLVDDKENLLFNPLTLKQDTYCTLRVKAANANTSTTLTNIQIERGETATTYEAYQSRYYKPRETEEIILRSLPNGVCDTFNLQTGELVQNIGVAIYDGSDDELWGNDGVDSNNIPYFTITKSLPAIYRTDKLMYNCDIYKPCLDIDTDKIAITTTHYGLMLTANSYIRIKNGTTTREEFMASLKEKPVTLIYALKEPIITKLQTYNRVYNGQTNALANMGNNISALTYRYSTDYLKVGNLSPVPAVLESITSVPYDVRLKPSTLYTIKYNRGGNSDSMKFDLGGSVVEKTNATSLSIVPEELTVKTPAILSHEQLILSGTGYAHNFIVVEGDIRGTELPYFDGMCNAKMPIVKNVGKNLFHGKFELGTMSSSTGDYTDVTTAIRATDYTKVVGGKQYVCYCDDLQYKFAYVQYDKDKKFLRTSGSYVSGEVVRLQNDVAYVIMRTPNNATPIMNNPHVKLAVYEYEEGMDTTLQDYKENSIYITQGEIPITSEMIEQGGFSTGNPTSDGSYETMKYGEENGNYLKRLRSKNLIPVKPNTTYAFAHPFSRFGYNVYQWNGNREFLQETSQYFASGQIETITTTANTQYIHFLISKHNASETITVAEYDWSQFHMYELDSTINLRSLPNGVKDELNLLTGEYIQRVGEVVLDGGEEQQWFIGRSSNANLLDFYIHNIIPNALDNGNGISDKFNYVNGVWNVNVAGICVNVDKGISMMLPTKYVKTQDLQGCLEWLQSNPVTVQYELEEPITSHVRLVSNNQEREVGVKLPNGVCNTYNPSTGITTVRVGKIVLDGSEEYESWGHVSSYAPNVYSVWTANPLPNVLCATSAQERISAVCSNGLQFINAPLSDTDKEFHFISYTGRFNFNIALSKLSTQDVEGVKKYLASNPITVWYELKYPQIQPDIVLPNGVHDEYNPETGVYTKKVHMIEFTGGRDENWQVAGVNPFMYIYLTNPLCRSMYYICDSYTCLNNVVSNNQDLGTVIVNPGDKETCLFRVRTQEILNGMTVSEWKTYLSQNPIKLWYELQTPITYQLTPYFGLPQPYAYEDGYLIHDSAYIETTLPPEFKYKLVANRTGQVMQNSRKLQEHTVRLSNLEALIIEATIESLFNRELQMFELELMDIQLIDLGE